MVLPKHIIDLKVLWYYVQFTDMVVMFCLLHFITTAISNTSHSVADLYTKLKKNNEK